MTVPPTPPYHPADLAGAQADFTRRFPAIQLTQHLDELRSTEYHRLDAQGQVYLDYTGGGLYAESQLRQHMQLLSQNTFGNPHSHNPTSLAMTALVERARRFVLEYFNAPPDEYLCIFTPNASGALKLVGESYPFEPGSQYALSFDNHNSVNGIREFARRAGAAVTYIPLTPQELRLDQDALEQVLSAPDLAHPNLFAYPAQSNFSGVQHPLENIDLARRYGWDVLVDCAAFAPSNRLDIGAWKPDFATFSFYKIFGYPTGLGCLLVRRERFNRLRRPWFAGGTITIASVQGFGHYLHENEAAFEDGTVDYLNIPAVEIGLRYIHQVGMEAIHTRVMALTGWLLEELAQLHHSNGRPLVHIHGPKNLQARGGTVTITLHDPQGWALDDHRIEELANLEGISLRTGCFCNPGAGEISHGLSAAEMRGFFERGERVSFLELRNEMRHRFHKSVSAVRISTGLASNFADVYRFAGFISKFLDQGTEQVGLATYERDSAHHLRDAT